MVNVWKVTSVIFLIWAVMASVGTAYIYQISQNQQTRITNLEVAINTAVKVNLCIDYGNGTAVWHNNTGIPVDSNLLNVTMKVANVNYTTYTWGVFINSINNVSPVGNQYWGWSSYSEGNWLPGMVGASTYQLRNGEMLKWELISY
jgi:hypothetical protein